MSPDLELGRALAVLPAAGSSRRMGQPKLLLPYGETTLLGALLGSLERAAVRPIVLVVTPSDRELHDWASTRDVIIAHNPRPERGMLSSIQAGLSRLGDPSDLASVLVEQRAPLLVSPADLPRLEARTVRQLLDAFASSSDPLVVPRHAGRRGHPLVIPGDLVGEIFQLELCRGLRQLRQRHPERLMELDVEDPGVLLDVDTPEHYRRLTGRLP